MQPSPGSRMSYPGSRYAPPTVRRYNEPDTTGLTQERVDLLQTVPETDHSHEAIKAQDKHVAGQLLYPDGFHDRGYPDDMHRHSRQENKKVRIVQDDQRKNRGEVTVLGTSSDVLDQNLTTCSCTRHKCSHESHDTPEPIMTPACQICNRESSVYYNQQRELGYYNCHNVHATETSRDESVYFKYFNLTGGSRTGTLLSQGSKAYEPIKRFESGEKHRIKNPKPAIPPKPIYNKKQYVASRSEDNGSTGCSKMVFSCCMGSNANPRETRRQDKESCSKNTEANVYDSPPYHHRPSSPSPDSSPVVMTSKRTSKMSEWSRVRRLLFLVGILLGIMVAVGGIVVGFIILAPPSNAVDNSLKTDTSDPEGMPSNNVTAITITPRFQQPVRDSDGWVYFAQGSDYATGSRYMIINRAMMFSAAQQECRSHGGHLPFVTSLREQVFLEDFIAQELLNPDIMRDGVGFWLGARRARGSHSGTCLYKQWKWVDVYGQHHGIVNGFTAFGEDKPDNHFNPEECLYLSYKNTSPNSFLKWDDAPCDIPTIGRVKVICEVDDRR